MMLERRLLSSRTGSIQGGDSGNEVSLLEGDMCGGCAKSLAC